jgi:tyrosine-specific transport protein
MAATGILFLELSLTLGDGANLVTMARKTLGPPGKWFAWGVYLFLFYCLTLAYIVGCGNLLSDFSNISDAWGPPLFVLLFGPLIYAGARVVGKLNVFFMLALALFFFAFVFLGYRSVKTELLLRSHWKLSLMALPIAFTSFAFQGIVPTLTSYMNHDAKKIRQAILIGSFIPLVTYVIWQWLILGIVPVEGENGLAEALAKGQNAVMPLKHFIGNPIVYYVGQYFAFFALLTSFFGVTLGLKDFLADGLKIKKDSRGKMILCSIIFIPPLIFAMWHPHVFLSALEYAGGYGCAILLGLMPVLMVWSKRYKLKLDTPEQLPGGKVVLVLLFIFVIFELLVQMSMS